MKLMEFLTEVKDAGANFGSRIYRAGRDWYQRNSTRLAQLVARTLTETDRKIDQIRHDILKKATDAPELPSLTLADMRELEGLHIASPGHGYASRAEVYAAIDSERDYQEQKWPGNFHSPVEFLVYMQDYLTEAMRVASRQPDEVAIPRVLESIRKITAMGVACMEQHGAPKREVA
jgi:hypothetical protein